MKKVRAAIVGYGNIGHYVFEALQAAPDFEIAGVVRRAGAENCPAELGAYPVVKNIKELKDVDVAILCTPTRKVEEYAKEILALDDSLRRFPVFISHHLRHSENIRGTRCGYDIRQRSLCRL